jgi:hypothetical protein
LASKEGAQCPTIAQLSEQFAQTKPFRHRRRMGESLLRSEAKTRR